MAAHPTLPDWPKLLAQAPVRQLVELALSEDVGGVGDVTTQAIFKGPARVSGHIVCRTPTVACGLALVSHLLQRYDPDATVQVSRADGSSVPADGVLVQFNADVRTVLTVERTLLNFLMRLCGVAHAARQAVMQLPTDAPTRIFDTRKTLPGWRTLDKAAVRTGGAHNHRMGLYDGILIKDNHIAAAGSLTQAVRHARARVGHTMEVEVEVDTLAQLHEALAAQPDVILLDNFSLDALRQAVRQTAGRVELEASGGITLDDIAAVAATGVHRISMGSLTHSIKPADLSLEVLP